MTRQPREPLQSEIDAILHAFERRSYAEMQKAAQALGEACPASPFGWKALGLALLLTGSAQKALAPLQRSLELKADDPEVFFYLAAAWRGLGQTERALASYVSAIELRPTYGEAHVELGTMLVGLKRFAEAEPHFRQSIAANPRAIRGHMGLGVVLRHLDRLGEAETCFRHALSLEPNNPNGHYNLGNFLRDARRFADAEKPYRRAIELDAGHLQAMNNLAETLVDLGRLDEAVAGYDKVLSLKPDYAGAHNNRGVALRELGRFDDALAGFDKAVSFSPDYAEAFHNKALTLLLLGRLESAWSLYEWRKKTREPVGNREFTRPLLTSVDGIENKVVLVHWEQGMGDTFQFCRYVRLLRRAGATVLLAPQPRLIRLLGSLDSAVELVDVDRRDLSFDCHVPLAGLPLAFRTSLETIPAETSYVRAEAERVELWRRRLGEQGFKVGICWQGNPSYPRDASRSFAVTHFASIARIPGVRLISLQKGEGERQLAGLPEGMTVETLGDGFDAGLDAFVDTAAVMTLCDLVITSDTAAAHLAGALGVRTWVALTTVPDWRWMLERDDSPWYPTLRLFRQRRRGDWETVFREIEAAVRALL